MIIAAASPQQSETIGQNMYSGRYNLRYVLASVLVDVESALCNEPRSFICSIKTNMFSTITL